MSCSENNQKVFIHSEICHMTILDTRSVTVLKDVQHTKQN